ncbi:MAG: hypothetical protein A3F84_18510 [Candidatus Handelsmanbacteria bacterium RIFCSPLOWO2_12_FULL_64_10]|uniref:Histidine ammonia-lyase n=1 Tax=Handelsmanbacteria sp. (strain RIFCSPLOWO2_12_FULL_64_10) TaxID=1817868 RepID=A0A1F6D734_HANXR|nr:MAG: hypothetical protein A3F84_18510 [Candidatus Handelsmanbacteria bacterium RIFCSPLOWO2_12_FULL_64_10]
MSGTRIEPAKLLELQENLVRSHALAIGDPLGERESALVLLLRAHALAQGYSGCTPALVAHLTRLFNRRRIPVVTDGGSVGASGDLAPLAVLASAVMGEGRFYGARPKPYRFREKEALSMINGTQLIAALLGAALVEARVLIDTADVVGAMSLEALHGSRRPFDAGVMRAKPHRGMETVGRRFRRLLAGSAIMTSHKSCGRVQDAYSIRCIPQVHGSVRDAFDFATDITLREINAATDNPLVLGDGSIVSAGNFHGQSVAHAADTLGSALTTLGNISERRIERLTNPDLSELPAFLAPEGGLNSGFMALQVAAAALAAENRVLAYPASVTTIPTSASKEDHVSMGPTAARHARKIAANVSRILAMEAICAAQALEFLRPLRPGRGVARAQAVVRRRVRPLGRDRDLTPDVAGATRLVREGGLRQPARQ